MNSCLYNVSIMHCRVAPKRHKFTHKVFMFYLDLDELDEVALRINLFSRNKSNIYNFRDADHMEFDGAPIKENVIRFIRSKGVQEPVGRIMLLTNVRTFGYIFNPVSFYFCFDQKGEPLCVVPEIGNTFREMKPYFIGKEQLQKNSFNARETKYFYISPFVALDIPMDFRLAVPDERLNIKIDDLKDNKKFLYTTMTGPKIELSNANLLWYSLCYPFVTLKVIFLIHMHAAILHYIKRIPHYMKEDNPQLQKEVLRAWSKE